MNSKDIISPIGVYDSGVGALTVIPALKRYMPKENWLVLSDNANVPYGDKSSDQIIECSFNCIKRLQKHGVKAVIVACHTSSAFAVDVLQKEFDFPIIGMLYPTAFGIASFYQKKDVIWLATNASVNADKVEPLARSLGYLGDFHAIACKGWVESIEKGLHKKDVGFQNQVQEILSPYLQILSQKKAVVLYGCTHYPWVEPIITQKLCLPVQCINPADWVGVFCRKKLSEERLLSFGSVQGKVEYIEEDKYSFVV